MRELLQKALSFQGRIGKREYAISLLKYMVYSVISYVVCSFLMYLQMTNLHSNSNRIWNDFDVAFNFVLLILAYLLPIICIVLLNLYFYAQGVKRCHDVGLSGWYILIPFFFIVLLFTEGTPTETHTEVSSLTPNIDEIPPTDVPDAQSQEELYEWPIDNTGIFTNVFSLIGRISRLEFFLVLLLGFVILIILPFLIIIWRLALLAESIKRLHDVGLSGYWCIPAFVASLSMSFFSGIASPWIIYSCLAVFCIYVLILLLIPGNKGINQYGTNPSRSYREQTLEAGYPDI